MNTDVSSVSSLSKRSRDAPQTNTLGNRHKFRQQKVAAFTNPANSMWSIECSKIEADADAIKNTVETFRCECGTRRGTFNNCLLKAFCVPGANSIDESSSQVNWAGAVALVKQQRDLIRVMHSLEFDQFLQEEFRKCIQKAVYRKNADGSESNEIDYYAMNYNVNGIVLCRQLFAFIFSTTVTRLRSISEALKLSANRRVFSTKIRSYTDRTIHDFTWAETEQLLKKNLGWVTGKDEDMIRAGLTPFSDTQRTCIEWLKNHFSIFGDSDPARDMVHLLIMTRREIYRRYCAEMKAQEEALKCPLTSIYNFSNFYI